MGNYSYTFDGWTIIIRLLEITGVFFLTFCILMLISLWKIFKKAGYPEWACLIPFYNIYILCRIAFGQSFFLWVVLIFWIIPTLIPIAYFFSCLYLAKSFGKSLLFGFCTVLLPVIFVPILAFSSAKYVGLIN